MSVDHPDLLARLERQSRRTARRGVDVSRAADARFLGDRPVPVGSNAPDEKVRRRLKAAAYAWVRQCPWRGAWTGTRACSCVFRCFARFGPPERLGGRETTERDCLDCLPRNLALRVPGRPKDIPCDSPSSPWP